MDKKKSKHKNPVKQLPIKVYRIIRKSFLTEILVLGDSHTKVFSHKLFKKRLPNHFFNIIKVKGATASGLENPNSKTQAYSIFKKALAKTTAKQVIVLLGEVDIGFVIWYRASKYNVSVDHMSKLAIKNYTHFLSEISNKFDVICISAPLPTIKDNIDCSDMNNLRSEVKASQLARTKLTLEFNRTMNLFCINNGISYLMLDAESIGKDGILKKELLSEDPCEFHYDKGKYAALIIPKIKDILAK